MRSLLIVIVAVVVSLAVMTLLQGGKSAATQETTYDRIMRTGTLRCGYAAWYPNLIIDLNTKQFSGISFDVMQEVGRRLGLKIEWAQEAGFGSAEQDLKSGKYDVLCADVCFESKRNKAAYFSRPFRQDPIFMTARGDDTRFKTYQDANREDIMVAVLPGMIIESYAVQYLPQAKRLNVNDLGAEADMMNTLSSRKADVSFNNLISVDLYNQNNDGKIKALRPAVDICNGSFMLPHGDERLKNMIDGALDEIIASGQMPNIYTKYMPNHPDYWRVPEQTMLRGKER